jgi:hypothetical protein
MPYDITASQSGPPRDIDDLIYGDAGTVPSERIYQQ